MQKLKPNNILQKGLAILLAFLLFAQSSGFPAVFAEEETGSTKTVETSAEGHSQVISPAAIMPLGLRNTPGPAKLNKVAISVTPKGSPEHVLADGEVLSETISQDSILKIRYDFDSPVGLVGNPGWKTFELPLSSTGGLNIADLEAGNPYPDPVNQYFKYAFDAANKKIVVTFDEAVLPAQGSECYIEMAVNFSLNQSNTDNQHVFQFPHNTNGPKEFTLRFLPKNVDPSVVKDGKFIATDFPALTHEQLQINPHEIEWTADVNRLLKTVPEANAVIEDTYNANQLDYKGGSLQVYALNIALDGTITQGGLLTETTDYTLDTATAGKIKLHFTDAQLTNIGGAKYLTKAYRLVYKTNIKPSVVGKDIKIKNNISFAEESSEKELLIKHKITDKARKHSSYYVQYSPYKYWLRWSVDINFAQQKLLSFEDAFDTKLRLIHLGNNNSNKKLQVFKIKPESIHKTSFNSSDLEEIVNWETIFTLDTGADENKVALMPRVDTRDAYRIVFDTEIRNGEMPPFTNQASYKINTPAPNTTTPAPEKEIMSNALNIGPIASDVSKALDEVFGQELADRGYHIDYHRNEIRWRINIEPKTGTMTNLKITDTYPNKGLTYVNGSLSVKRGSTELVANTNGNPASPVPGADYTFVDKGENGFEIVFHTQINAVVQILYKTKFDRNNHSNPANSAEARKYKNQIKYSWDEVPGTAANPKEANPDPFTAFPYVPDNGGKWSSDKVNPDRTIDWVIYVNYNGENIPNLVVNDTIGAGHELELDSIQVKNFSKNIKTGSPDAIATLKNEPEVSQAEYQISNKKENGFTVTFPNTNGKLYAITYKTKLSDTNVSQSEYINTATLADKTVTKKISFPNHNKFVDKSGVQGNINTPRGWYVDWSVKINQSLSYIPNAVITDTLSAGQEYDPASVKLYLATNTNLEVPNPNNELYTVEFTPIDPATKQQSMIIRFNKPIEFEYLLKYSSLVPNPVVPQVSNTIEIKGENVVPINQRNQKNVAISAVSTNAGSRPHSAFGSITIIKKDKLSNALLSGIGFELWKGNVKLLDFLNTDTNGKTILQGLVPGTYTIKEKAHPDYVTAADVDVTISSGSLATLNITKEILNVRKGSISLKKLDKVTNAPLKDVRFELWQGGSKVADFPLTSASGDTKLTGLAHGTYTVKEIPVNGYMPIADFTVTISESNVDHMQIVQNVKKGSISLKKVDKTTNAPLANIRFELWQGTAKVADFPLTSATGNTKLDNLTHGIYTVKEIEPETHMPIADFTVTLSESNADHMQTVQNVRKGSISIIKTDKGQNKPLADIVFSLHKSSGELVSDFVATDADGKTKLVNIPHGSYLVREKESMHYHSIADIPVTINESNLDLTLNIENVRREPLSPYEPSPKPDNNTPTPNPQPEKPKEDPKPDTPKADTPKPDTPKPEVPKSGVPKPDTPQPDTPSPKTPEPDTPTTTEINTPIVVRLNIPDGEIPRGGREPKNGIVEFDGNNYKYIPNKDFVGKDNFSIIITRPDGSTYEEEVEIEVEVPQGAATLPKTDGLPPILVFLFGSMLVVCGFVIKKRY